MGEQLKLKVGDKVRVRAARAVPGKLPGGRVLTVTAVDDQPISPLCKVEGSADWWFIDRFEVVASEDSAKKNSAEALRKVDIGGVHQKIMDTLRLFPGRRASSTEIEKASKLKAHKRMPELERLGFVKRDGKTKVDGRNVTVWEAVA